MRIKEQTVHTVSSCYNDVHIAPLLRYSTSCIQYSSHSCCTGNVKEWRVDRSDMGHCDTTKSRNEGSPPDHRTECGRTSNRKQGRDQRTIFSQVSTWFDRAAPNSSYHMGSSSLQPPGVDNFHSLLHDSLRCKKWKG